MKPDIYKDEGYKLMGAAFTPGGYLINFGSKDLLEWKRFILSEFVFTETLASISEN